MTEQDVTDSPTAGSKGFGTWVNDRLVVVTIGSRSQTVAVCTPANQRGEYETRYRLVGRAPLVRADFDPYSTVDELCNWLESLGSSARKEDPQSVTSALPALITVPTSDDPWLRAAILAVEAEIDRLVEQFLDKPFMHRVEQSVHAQLFSMLMRHPELCGDYEIDDTGQRSQLLHMEWPETIRDGSATKRGSFDLAVLEPSQLAAATLDHIRTGSIAAGIVIELGLNYGLGHLQQDWLKLRHSEVPAGYLVHLSRDGRRDPQVERYIEEHDGDARTKIAYAHSGDRGIRAVKLLNDAKIRER